MEVFQAAKSFLRTLPFLERPSQQRSTGSSDDLLVPWRAESPIEEPYEESFKRRILQIPQEELAFLQETEDSRRVDVTALAFASAGNVLQKDANLRQLRFRLVPKSITEEQFWRRYFGQVARIKREVMACGEVSGDSSYIHVPSPLHDSTGESSMIGAKLNTAAAHRSGHSETSTMQQDAAFSPLHTCNSQSSSLTETMMLSPRYVDAAKSSMEGIDDVSKSFPQLQLGKNSLSRSETSQYARLEDEGEDDQAMGPSADSWATSYGEWLLV